MLILPSVYLQVDKGGSYTRDKALYYAYKSN